MTPPRIPKDVWTPPTHVHPRSVAWRLVRTERDPHYGYTLHTYARDGIEVSHDAHGQVAVDFEQPYRHEQVQDTLDEVLARLDREYPAPFPGPREGQIWWWPLRNRATTLRAHAGGGWSSSAGSRSVTEETLVASLQDCLLLYDPLRPEAAPWSRHPLHPLR